MHAIGTTVRHRQHGGSSACSTLPSVGREVFLPVIEVRPELFGRAQEVRDGEQLLGLAERQCFLAVIGLVVFVPVAAFCRYRACIRVTALTKIGDVKLVSGKIPFCFAAGWRAVALCDESPQRLITTCISAPC